MSMIDRTAEVLARVEERAAAAVRKAAGVVLEEVEQRTPVNTGTGERSYHVADGDDPHTVYVTNTEATAYLKYVEQGTSKMAARPHMVPGAEAAKSRATEELAQSLREEL